MYLGMAMILLGIAILMGTLTPLAVVIAFSISMERVFVKAEEKSLTDKFGNDWLEYKKRVRKWI